MDPFGHDGLSDEIVLNILAHIPDATAYLSFAGVSKRLRNLCTYEETRSPYWRLFYAQEYRIDPLELQYYLGERYLFSASYLATLICNPCFSLY
jgi:hypothetical protein